LKNADNLANIGSQQGQLRELAQLSVLIPVQSPEMAGRKPPRPPYG
jgi:hypothetical protein